VVENPAAGNYEELADLLLDEKEVRRGRANATTRRSPRAAIRIRSTGAASPKSSSGISPPRPRTLEDVTSRDDQVRLQPRDCAARARLRRTPRSPRRPRRSSGWRPIGSTLSETYLNYAAFLASQNRNAEARGWAQKVLARKSTIPR